MHVCVGVCMSVCSADLKQSIGGGAIICSEGHQRSVLFLYKSQNSGRGGLGPSRSATDMYVCMYVCVYVTVCSGGSKQIHWEEAIICSEGNQRSLSFLYISQNLGGP